MLTQLTNYFKVRNPSDSLFGLTKVPPPLTWPRIYEICYTFQGKMLPQDELWRTEKDSKKAFWMYISFTVLMVCELVSFGLRLSLHELSMPAGCCSIKLKADVLLEYLPDLTRVGGASGWTSPCTVKLTQLYTCSHNPRGAATFCDRSWSLLITWYLGLFIGEGRFFSTSYESKTRLE